MRKKLAKLLAAAMCVSCLGIHAAAAELSFNGSITVDGVVSVSGFGNDGLVSVEIVPGMPESVSAASGNAVIVDVTSTGENGSFAFTWELPESEKFPPLATGNLEPKYYTAIFGNTGQETDAATRKLLLCYAPQSVIDAAVAEVNAATETTMKSVLDTNQYVLQIGGFLLDDAYKTQNALVISGLIAARASQPNAAFTLDTLHSSLSQSLGFAALKVATADTLNTTVLRYGDALGLDTANYLANANGLQAAMNELVVDVIGAFNLTNPNDSAKAFRSVEAVATVNLASRGKIVGAVEDYKDIFGFDTTTLGNNAGTMASKLIEKRGAGFRNVKAVQDAYTAALTELNDGGGGNGSNSNNNGSSGILPGSGSTGGGYYGGASGSLPAIEVEAPEKEQPEINKPFNDLDSVPWAEEYINALASAGIINGKAEGIFAPNDSVTREEFTKMLALALELPEATTASDFSDVAEGAWYVPYVNAVAEAGLIKGYEDGTFGIGTPIIREEAAVLIARAMDYKKLEVGAAEVTFTDTLEISEFAIDSVAICVGAQIIQGNDANQFLPRNAITRAECAKIIYCLLELF